MNCKRATPLPLRNLGFILNSGSIQSSFNDSFTLISVTGLASPARWSVSMPEHTPHPSVDTLAMTSPLSTPSGNTMFSR